MLIKSHSASIALFNKRVFDSFGQRYQIVSATW